MTDKTKKPQVTPKGAVVLEEDQLDKAAGGVIAITSTTPTTTTSSPLTGAITSKFIKF